MAPSDMMDGRIGAIKTALVNNGLEGKVQDIIIVFFDVWLLK